MFEKISDALPQENKEKSIHEEAMEGVLKKAEEKSKANNETFENTFLSLLESDGYTGGLNSSMQEALGKRDIARLVQMAHINGWL